MTSEILLTEVYKKESRKRERFFHGEKPEGDCEKCGARPATGWWSGTSSFMDVNHGARIDGWCELCMVETQLEHAKTEVERLTKSIPELEAKRAELLVPVNLRAPIQRVKHAELTRANDDSAFKSKCPACENGILLVARDPEDLSLFARHDRCIICAQAFFYTDDDIHGMKFAECPTCHGDQYLQPCSTCGDST